MVYTYNRQKVAYPIPKGKLVEIGRWRFEYRDYSVIATDTTNAGKRGKRVPVFKVNARYGDDDIYEAAKVIYSLVKKNVDFNTLVRTVKQVIDGLDVSFYVSEERGVDVMPAGFQPLSVEGKGVLISAGYDSFRVLNTNDPYNDMTCIPAIKGGKKSIPVFYRWVKENMSAIKNMTFHDVTKAMDQLGIKYHMYCAYN